MADQESVLLFIILFSLLSSSINQGDILVEIILANFLNLILKSMFLKNS